MRIVDEITVTTDMAREACAQLEAWFASNMPGRLD